MGAARWCWPCFAWTSKRPSTPAEALADGPRKEWTVTDDTHLAIVDDKTFEAAQSRFGHKLRGAGSSHRKRAYLFAGMVKCDADHGLAAMHGKAPKGHHYYCCDYAARYGEVEALAAHDGAKTISVREDRLLKLVLRFFEQRIFGPLRIERLEKQLRAQARSERANGKLVGTKLRNQIAELDRKIKAQIISLEEGIEPELVTARIGELRGEKETLVEALEEVGPEREEEEDEELARQLSRVPDLAKSLAEAPPAVQRQVIRSLRAPDRLRQGRRPGRDFCHRCRGRRRCLREHESPPEGGLSGGSERDSGGPIRLSQPPADH